MRLRLFGVLLVALGLIFICGDCVKAEDLHYDIIRYADANELGQKQKWIIGHVDTVYSDSYEVAYDSTYLDWLPDKYDSVTTDHRTHCKLWYTAKTLTHRQFVDLQIVKDFEIKDYTTHVDSEGFLVYDPNKPDTTFGEALITWREVTK